MNRGGGGDLTASCVLHGEGGGCSKIYQGKILKVARGNKGAPVFVGVRGGEHRMS
jgi:hypothetical protein